LRKELPIEMQNQWKFGRRWLDVKTIYQHWRNSKGLSVQAGLAKAMTKMGLTFQGTKHQAPDDALNTFRVYHHLMKEWK
jgi:inhibitor of KinA sporulation pathway (predicted exonuclease)